MRVPNACWESPSGRGSAGRGYSFTVSEYPPLCGHRARHRPDPGQAALRCASSVGDQMNISAVSMALCALLLISLELAACEPAASRMAQKRVENQSIWRGRSDNFILTWTTSDLRATLAAKPAQVVFEVAPGVKRHFEAFLAALKASGAGGGTDAEPCTYERTFKLLSVVGSLVSLEDAYYAFCRGWAHPAVETRFTALDLARPGELAYAESAAFPPLDIDVARFGKAIELTDIAAAPDILRALLSDPIIRKALENLGQPPPATLPQLQRLLADQSLEAGECLFRFPEDVFTRFAFHHLEGDHMAVRLGLPPNVGVCRTHHAQLGLLLPIPPALRVPLARAASRKAGFLMQDQKKIAGTQATTVAFGVGTFARD
jgi:hypothetical protein